MDHPSAVEEAAVTSETLAALSKEQENGEQLFYVPDRDVVPEYNSDSENEENMEHYHVENDPRI